MLINFSDLTYDGKWYPFKDGELKVRPYPASLGSMTIKRDMGGFVVEGDEQLKFFSYCLEDWKNFTDSTGKPIKLTDEVKKKIYDFKNDPRFPDFRELVDFVLSQNGRLEPEKAEQEKNS